MAGYSGTPLAKKLGFKEGFRAGFVNPPEAFQKELGTLPADVEICVETLREPLDLIIFFTDSKQTLKREFPRLANKLARNGLLWVSWPKKSSGVITDLSDTIVRETGLAAGLVDVKVCAINDIWSGLKFVYRLIDRYSR
ncbi:MAG TPA: hypothetical protein VMZ30_09295 [Pyrinomonadaceae bacterium]|nr:hypothetical protein [Pyrinomonadaceae bacterium]